MERDSIQYFGWILCFIFASIHLFKWIISLRSYYYSKKYPNISKSIIIPNPFLYGLSILLIFTSITLMVLSLGKVKPYEADLTNEYRSVDLVFVIDLSLSMNAVDVSPNRLKRFLDISTSLLPELKGNRIGIIIFAGNTFHFCPLTTDLSAIKEYLNALSVEIVGKKGSDLNHAIGKTNEFIKRLSGLRSPIVIFVSDGEDHEGGQMEPILGDLLVWGVGTQEGGPIEFRNQSTSTGGYVTKYGGLSESFQDDLIISKLNEDYLMRLASISNGSYYNLTNETEATQALLNKIKMSEKDTRLILERIYKEDGANDYLFFSLLLFFLERMLSAWIGYRMKVLAAIVFLFFIPFSQKFAWELDPGGSRVQRGNEAFQDQKFKKSIEEYESATPFFENEPKLDFNKANSYFKQGEYWKSLEYYNKALNHKSNDSELKSKSYYNKGNVHLKLGNKKEALDSYVKALEYNRDFLQAKKNIEFLTKSTESQRQNEKNKDAKNKPNTGEINTEKSQRKEDQIPKSTADKILDPFSRDNILKNKIPKSMIDNEKFW
ncbi:MAG: VWA domain-containing protein [Leptospira sp.]|nr:VWA domain-containing protein [Leptospira sp.]